MGAKYALDKMQVQTENAAQAVPATVRLPRAPRNGLAHSLERKRLRFYLAQIVADLLILFVSFAAANTFYERTSIASTSMAAVYMLQPLFLTIALYDNVYSLDSLTNWRRASLKVVVALVVSAALFSFFAFFAKMNADFSRVVFLASLLFSTGLMVLFRALMARWFLQPCAGDLRDGDQARRWRPGVFHAAPNGAR